MKELIQELKAFIIETMNLEDTTPNDIGDDLPLFTDEGLGLDSIDALELVLALKKPMASRSKPMTSIHANTFAQYQPWPR